MNYIVYTEIHDWNTHTCERWYYGTWHSREDANEAAYELGRDPERGIWHCICPAYEAEAYGILNLPTAR